jgi:hypothetical protein
LVIVKPETLTVPSNPGRESPDARAAKGATVPVEDRMEKRDGLK